MNWFLIIIFSVFPNLNKFNPQEVRFKPIKGSFDVAGVESWALEFEFEFKRISLEIAPTGTSTMSYPFTLDTAFILEIIPFSFSYKLPYDILLKVKSNVFSRWWLVDCYNAYGVSFLVFTDYYSYWIWLRLMLGKKFLWYFNKIFVEIYPCVELMPIYECVSFEAGIEVSIGRRLK